MKMKEWSKYWKSSKNPKKQRKYRYNAPLHIKGKFLSAHLSKELRKKTGKRSIRIRKGDKVSIVRGNFKKKNGTVEGVDLKGNKVYISKIEVQKKDGTKSFYPIDPSNVVITELVEDKKRLK